MVNNVEHYSVFLLSCTFIDTCLFFDEVWSRNFSFIYTTFSHCKPSRSFTLPLVATLSCNLILDLKWEQTTDLWPWSSQSNYCATCTYVYMQIARQNFHLHARAAWPKNFGVRSHSHWTVRTCVHASAILPKTSRNKHTENRNQRSSEHEYACSVPP